MINVCSKELKETWEKRSTIKIEDSTPKGDRIDYLIIHYLATKNLTKDAQGINQLSDEDISRIEKGFFYPKEKILTAPFHNLRFQLNNMTNPNGNSLLQRIEHWKTARKIISENWLFGVGTGDVQLAFDKKYDETNSLLLPENRNRSHNQFFAIWIGIGVFGLVIFLWFHFKFIQFQLQNNQLLGLSFIVICITSYFFEDSLETQQVVSFFGLFFGLMGRKMMNYNANSILGFQK